jgi:DNA-binding transcriptional ArsR family regulator
VAILKTLRIAGSADVEGLSESLDEPQSRIVYHAGVLEKAGRVERDGSGTLRLSSSPS